MFAYLDGDFLLQAVAFIKQGGNPKQLKQAGIVAELTRAAKVIKSGELTRKVTLRGLGVTAGAKAAIEAAGGSVVVDAPAA